MLAAEGSGPIVTSGTHLRDGSRVVLEIPGKVEITAAMAYGTLECLVDFDSNTASVYCDLPNARISLAVTPPGRRQALEAYALRAYQHETIVDAEPEVIPGIFAYPGWAKLVTLRWN